MFLTVLVPGPRNPKEKLDVFLQPLIAELKHLWEVGVPTYDISLKQNFHMRAVLIWTISDFSAYSMLSGWSTAGRLACPHCMENTDAFTLEKSGDNHRKFLPANHAFRRNKKAFRRNKTITVGPPVARSGEDIFNQIQALGLIKVTEDYDDTNKNASNRSGTGWKKMRIFWDLPYWKDLLIRYNLDVMHIEKNVFDNVFNIVLNVLGKTKDTIKSREELNLYCTRPELNRNESSGKYPKASYTLDKNEKKVLCEWVKNLRFPYGYMSNMSRCVDMSKLKMYGMKSHDCHVFMQRILPVAFRELIPQNVWKAITELCLFFKDLTSRTIQIDDMCRLNDNSPIILCNLERIFPPSFFDSMKHLPVHLPNEARLAGPVQYRWMYPFERYLRKLKNHTGSPLGKMSKRYLDAKEYKAAQIYILLNCHEVTDIYLKLFEDEMVAGNPFISASNLGTKIDEDFVDWFKRYVNRQSTNNIVNKYIQDLAKGPLLEIKTYPGYIVNGYRFHTIAHGAHRATMNSRVCIKGEIYNTDELDFYGAY
ncbi:uncharacterized protein LOC130994246 [Salvia miltiorrhiza]|uniref:uncharacterized protein LOC130994246 n=1 Tax=Salvia miltiorrhiza TaxID=226208 RepID=UPI0025AC4F4F|nr:uncharacterized protein LOC130994246 [Salvia miltiorrhiza]